LFLRQVEQTILLNPNAPYIIGVAGWHMMLYGEWERGLSLLKKGMKLNPYYPSWFHLASYMHAYVRGAYEEAFSEAVKFNFPGLYLDAVMRASALGQMGKTDAAGAALNELLHMVPDFALRSRELIGNYVKIGTLIEAIIEGLRKAGLSDSE
jgi:adenylate cyclase